MKKLLGIEVRLGVVVGATEGAEERSVSRL